MTDQYATAAELEDRLSTTYQVPDLATSNALLRKASELIDEATFGRAQQAWATGLTSIQDYVRDATCDQVEFWLEVGEEHDVVGTRGAISSGRFMMTKPPAALAPRARRTLTRGGLMWAGVKAV